MTFNGYCIRPPRHPWLLGGLGAILLITALLGLVKPSLPTGVIHWGWGIWLTGGVLALLRWQGPRSQEWGQGTLHDHQVTWSTSPSPVLATVVQRREFSPVLLWGVRIIWPVLVVSRLGIAAAGQPHGFSAQGISIVAIWSLLAWQAWLTPITRTILTIQLPEGHRRKIHVTRWPP